MTETTAFETATVQTQSSPDFTKFVDAIRHVAAREIEIAGRQLFRVNTVVRGDIFNRYLIGFEEAGEKQWHACSCCAGFLRKYGGLVRIDPETGMTKSILWDENEVDDFYKPSVKLMREFVESRPVNNVFYRQKSEQNSNNLGWKERGGFNHFYLSNAEFGLFEEVWREAGKESAKRTHEFQVLSRQLAAAPDVALEEALAQFENDAQLKAYPESAKKIRRYLELKKKVKNTQNHNIRKNLIWLQVALSQGTGFYRFMSSVEGLYVMNGDYVSAKRNFLAMTRPESYMRPQEDATTSNIAQAEKIIAELNLASALRRRCLRTDEIPDGAFVWKRKVVEEEVAEQTGVFDHLKPKDAQPKVGENVPVIQGGKITMTRFREEVLPKADRISMTFSPHTNYPFGVATTAVVEDAEPILKWDSKEHRNPISFYGYVRGSKMEDFNIPVERPTGKREIEFSSITISPANYFSKTPNTDLFFIVDGARDMQESPGLALFPETLRSELHPVRRTIEQFSNKGVLEGREEGFAGFLIQEIHTEMQFQVKVTSGKFATTYLIDRFK